jgi:hypothetical protein
MLQHEGALQIARAVQAGREPEMAFEESAGAPENGQNLSFSHLIRKYMCEKSVIWRCRGV